MSRALPPPGWYRDHQNPFLLRYWDGSAWTEHTRMPVQPAPQSSRGPGFGRGLIAGLVSGAGAIAAVVVLVAAALAIGTVASDSEGEAGDAARVQTRKAPQAPRQARPERDRRADRAHDEVTRDRREPNPPKPAPRPEPVPAPQPRTHLVTRVVDGDTLELGSGETVRLVGIDTPEVGECGYDRATAALARLVSGEQVRLVRSDGDRDHYGRLLRYVDLGGTDAGLRQIRNGLAIARYDSRDGYGFHPREPRYIAADTASRNLGCPRPAPAPAPQPLVGGGGACAPGYSPCVPPYPPDVDCADVNGPITVTGADPHGLDADGDGVACE
jgi:endonuclease YncB( thermonuclease family)